MAKFNPFDKGSLYDEHAARWQLETDVAEMTLNILAAGTYLPKFSTKEHADDYAYRKSMSVPLDMCRDGVRIRVDNLWRVAPKREADGKYKDTISKLIDNADNEGTQLDDFMRSAVWNHYVSGTDIVTQMSKGPEGILITTRADEQEHAIRPYFMQVPPLDRYDWATTGSGGFIWARYCLGLEPQPDEIGGTNDEVTRFLTVGRDFWRTHLVRKKRGQNETPGDDIGHVQVETEQGPHLLGEPPIVKFYFAESQKSGQGAVPLSLLTRAAVVAKVMLNVKSQADADLIAAVTRWFATGIQGELPDTISPNALITFPSPESTIAVLQGDVKHIAEKREWILLYIGEILRLLKFRGGMAEISASSGSGLKLAIERTDLDNELRATAEQCERVELEMMRQAVSLATGTVVPKERAAEDLGFSVNYNRDFVLEPVGEMLDNLRKWVKDCGLVADTATEITKEMLRQLANMMTREGTDVHTAILEQIEAESFEGAGAASAETEEDVNTEDGKLKPATAGKD